MNGAPTEKSIKPWTERIVGSYAEQNVTQAMSAEIDELRQQVRIQRNMLELQAALLKTRPIIK